MSASSAAERLPASPEELDDAWVTGVLRDSGAVGADAEVEVTGSEGVGVGSAFACQLFRLFLKGPEGTPPTMVVKLPIEGEVRQMLDAIGAYGREVLFYRELAPELPVRTPAVYVALQPEESTDFVLAMEDLVDCTAVDPLEGFTLEQAEAVVDGLAAFHSWSWENDEVLARYAARFWPVDSEAGQAVQAQYGQLFAHVWQLRRDALVELLPPAAVEISDRFVELQPRLVEELTAPKAITHGELRADNLFFDQEGKPVFIDFQTAQQECGVRELAYLLCTSVPAELIDEHEQALITRYCEQLAQSGVEDYPYERAAEQYRYAVAYNLLWPIMANVRWEDSPERGRAVLDDLVTKTGAGVERNRADELLGI